MKVASKLAIFSCVVLGGCANTETGNQILYEMLKASAGQLFFKTILWSIGFAVTGGLLACLLFFTLNAIGGYRSNWKHAKWLRGAILVLMTILFFVFFGVAGFFEGILQGSETILLQSELAKRVYPAVGKTGADLIASIYIVTPAHIKSSDKTHLLNRLTKAKLETFHQGRWELDVTEFFKRLDQVGTETFEALALNLKKEAQKSYPDLSEGIGEKILDWFLNSFGKMLIKQTAIYEMKNHGLYIPMISFTDGLKQAARTQGNSDTISHQELSLYIVQKTIAEPCLIAIKPLVRGYQMGILLFVFITLAVPVVLFWISYCIWSRGKSKTASYQPFEHP